MKYVRSFFSKVAVLGLTVGVLSFIASVQAQTKEGTAKVQALLGSAQYSEQGGPWQPLSVGKVLRAGTIIKTAAGSTVDLYLDQNGPVVRITAETTLGLDTLLYEQTGADMVIDTKLNLTSGRILGKVKKTAAASKYEVKVPTGTVGIRGTDYDISASGIVYVREGSVVVHYRTPSGKIFDVIVQAGEYFVPPVDPESAPAQPTSIPPAGFEPMEFPEIVAYTPPIGPAFGAGGPIPPPLNPRGVGTIVVSPIEPPVSPTVGTARTGSTGGNNMQNPGMQPIQPR
jgi:hypothetical protein